MAISPRLKDRLRKKHLSMSQLKGIKVIDSLTDRVVLDPSSNLPIYVINTNYHHIDNTRGVQRTTLVMSISPSGSTGDPSPLVVPSTWVPWPVTLEFPKKALLDSIEFRQALSSGDIAIVDPDTAIEVLSTPEGKAEYERAKVRYGASTADDVDEEEPPYTSVQTSFKEKMAARLGGHQKEEEEARKAARSEIEKLADSCSPVVTNFVTKVKNMANNNEEVTSPEVSDFLIINGESMTKEDMDYFTQEFLRQFPEIVNDPDVRSELDVIASRLS